MLLTGRITKELELGTAAAEAQQALLGDSAAGLWQARNPADSVTRCISGCTRT